MPYLNLDLAFHRHPKVKRLVGLLGRGAEGLLTRLWCHCGEHHCETGILTGYSGQEIEAIAEWWGEKGRALEVLVKLKFIEKIGQEYVIHDWLDHSGHLAALKAKGRANAAKRWNRIRDGTGSNASSITSSNAPKGEAGNTDSSKMVGAENHSAAACRLGFIWLSTKRGGVSNFDRESPGNFDDLLDDGLKEVDIETSIRERKKKSETIWVFCERLAPANKQNRRRLSGSEAFLRDDGGKN